MIGVAGTGIGAGLKKGIGAGLKKGIGAGLKKGMGLLYLLSGTDQCVLSETDTVFRCSTDAAAT